MSDSFQEKTEAPTPRRRQQAREEGQIARSPEIGTALLLFAAAGFVSVGSPVLASFGVQLLGTSALLEAAPLDTLDSSVAWIRAVGFRTLIALAPALAVMAGLATAAGAVQAGGALSTKTLEAKWERLAPHQNLKKLVGWRPIVELLKSLLKLGVVSLAVYLALRSAMDDLLLLGQRSPAALLDSLRGLSTRVLIAAGIAYIALALADYLYQVWEHEKGLRMTREELKREQKESEGDPMIKARRRAMGRQMARQQMFSAVPMADVVIANPTHVAVALRYQPSEVPAPVVLAMGERKVAQRIKAIAAESGVPIVENKPLARALLGSAVVGQAIPPELYIAVAEVLAFVMRQRASTGRAWRIE